MAPACLDVPPSFKEYDVSSSSPVPSSSLADRATPTYPATLPPHDSALYCIYPCNNGPGCKETTSSSTFLSYRPQDIYIYIHIHQRLFSSYPWQPHYQLRFLQPDGIIFTDDVPLSIVSAVTFQTACYSLL